MGGLLERYDECIGGLELARGLKMRTIVRVMCLFMYLGVECVLLCSLERECSGLVLWLSGESRFRSMVRESSMELKPRCLSKGGGRVLRLAPLPIRVWGRCFSQKSAEVEALLQELL